jgi:hypothetical protein
MAHVRTTILSALASAVTGLTTTEDRVFLDPAEQVNEDDIPCLVVYPIREQLLDKARVSHGPLVERWHLALTAGVQVIAGSAAQRDLITAEVQAAVAVTDFNHFLVDLPMVEFDTEPGAKKIFECTMQYGIRYIVNSNDMETFQ